jgi:hypothetical protein
VGIGTNAPDSKLHVDGNAHITGTLALPATASASVGVITLGGSPFVHNFGTHNTFLGLVAGNFTMTGCCNTASGFVALNSNTTGFFNTATGSESLNSNTTGAYNTATGSSALYLNTSGGNNTASGFSALSGNTTGSTNIGVGFQAGTNLTTGSNNIDIGNSGLAAEAGTIRIGTGGVQTHAFIAGIRGITTGQANAIAVVIDSDGQLGTTSSSRRSKFDINDMAKATEGLMHLRPVTFRYRAHGDNTPLQYGLIAEEVAEVYPELVARNKDGEVETVMYQFLAPMLLNEAQRQRRTIEDQRKTINRLEQRLEAVEQQLARNR